MRYADLVRKCYNQNILFSALLELTYRCNLDCSFCYNDRDLKGTPLTLAQYERFLRDLSKMGTLNLALSGGEPMAHPDFFRIGAMAREMGFLVRIKSNGHALRSNLLLRLKQEVDPYSIDLSLHGADAATHDRLTRVPGSFERLIQNVGEMRAMGIRIKFNVPLTRWNETQISDIFRIADSFGASITVDSSITPRDNGDTSPISLAATPDGLMQLSDVIEQRRTQFPPDDPEAEVLTPPDKYCGSGSSTITVDPHGNVYPCVQLRRAAGNLHSQSISEIWEGSVVLEEVREMTVKVKQWMDKQGPAARSMAFCPGTAHLETGNAIALYPLAELRKQIAEQRVTGKNS